MREQTHVMNLCKRLAISWSGSLGGGAVSSSSDRWDSIQLENEVDTGPESGVSSIKKLHL